MLVRLVGFGMGLGLLGMGLYEMTMPKSWAQRTTEVAEDYLPEPACSAWLEFTRLSPDAIRLMGVGKTVVGWMMVKMAF